MAPTDWPVLIGRLVQVRAEVDAADPERLQPCTIPRLRASEADVAGFEREIGEQVPAGYREFLLHADGWPEFEYDVDLFGLAELRGAGAWEIGLRTLEIYDDEGVLEDSGVSFDQIVPVAAGPGMSSVYALIRNGFTGAGTVLWWNDGQEIDRYPGFAEFITSTTAYAERRLSTLLGR
ncbi:SMI1/KNR4 family protein [Actinoplanes awajinensis]|uniref:SMI1/KNR4 family protein n=1 Tax=Actinoplanes awajinensis TaxID=135946 RepID=UPI000B2669EC|nr:SMI1/KNR4 family protein [Actinoplanes awajinensis]